MTALTSLMYNSEGSLRLNLVRKQYGLHSIDGVKVLTKNLTTRDLDSLTSIYTTWRDTVEVMPMKLTYRKPTFKNLDNTGISPEAWINNFEINTGRLAVKFNEKSNIVCYETDTSEWHIFKSCKRGNDVYVKQVKRKFKPVIDIAFKHKSYFSTRINKNRSRVKRTKLLYITGTCDHKITGPIGKSWLNFGSYWNTFITNVREQFEGAEYVRAWQSQKNGYPHFHALVYFPNFEFSVTPWFSVKNQRYEFRVHNRQKLNGKLVRDRLKEAWKPGNLDILAVSSVKKGLLDLVKYITKDLEGGESDLTNAMVWFFGKQSYSISKGFTRALIGKDIALAEPTNDDLINAEGVIQRSNSKGKLILIEVFPTIRADLLPNFTQSNLENYQNAPDPPPETIAYLDYFTFSCTPSSSRKTDDGVDIIIYRRSD